MTVVKLETYPYNKVAGTDKRHWWKQADTRTTFLVSSIADPKHMMVTRLMEKAASDLQLISDLKRETKEMTSWNSSGNFQQPQYYECLIYVNI